MVTNYLHCLPLNNDRFKYKTISLPTTPTIKHYFSLPIHDNGTVSGYGVDYLKFSIGRVKNKKLKIDFTSDAPEDFLIKVIKTSSDYISNPSVEDIVMSTPTETFEVSGVGIDWREIVLVVSVLKITKKPVSYSFSASLIPIVDTIPIAK